ncbi:MAG TPA: NAD(P)/FAD-dependent oxidoreductase [Elusimicrobiota bacterium]|nr:NAD(P)/FAD-dependent oxidoreductase [Elusimicrobiota bacterium]
MVNEQFDLTIIGAGPTGLYAAYYAGFRRLKVKIVDSLEELGGQVIALYPDKYVYDVAGFPRITGKELVKNLVDQALQYHPIMCLGEKVEKIERGPDAIYELTTSKGYHRTRAILITIGIGAFNPKRLPAPGSNHYEGRGLAYFVPDKRTYLGKRIVIVGGGDSAVDWALNLQPQAASVTLVHRRDQFRAHEDNVAKLKTSRVDLKLFSEIKELRGKERVEAVVITNTRTHAEDVIPADEVLACLGFEATIGPLTQWGLKLQGNDILVSTKMETNLPGIYAAGDVTAYPGKVKLIACGFGEAAIAVNNATAYLNPGMSIFPGHSSNQPLSH